jgi:hypothetical protein
MISIGVSGSRANPDLTSTRTTDVVAVDAWVESLDVFGVFCLSRSFSQPTPRLSRSVRDQALVLSTDA